MIAPIRLGVNVDHVATIRNARGGRHPDPVRAAKLAIAAGADGITAHLREDRRHIRDDDMARLKAEIDRPLNMEMAATAEMTDIALRIRPHAVCIAAHAAQIEAAIALGAPVVEFHTGAWCEALAQGHATQAEAEWQLIRAGVALAKSFGLEVHAGHGLDYATAETIATLADVVELNIGHFLIGEAVFDGLAGTVSAMRAAMDRGRAKGQA